MLTFDQFYATRREADLFKENLVDDGPCTGVVFADDCYIEHNTSEEYASEGKYYLLITNESWFGDDLEKLARILYDRWYIFETADK